MKALVLVGSVNRPLPYFHAANGDGLSVLLLDTRTGSLERLYTQDDIDNPTYLAFDRSTSTVFALSEVFGWNEGTVSSYRLDRCTGKLFYLNKQSTLGSLPAHTSFDDTQRTLLVANYSHEVADESPGRACAAFQVGADGRLAPPASGPCHRGSSRHAIRQRFAHPHGVWATPDSSQVAVTDLGLDRVFFYSLSVQGTIGREPLAQCVLRAGDGPRHLAFADGGKTMHVVAELSSMLVTFKRSSSGSGWIEHHRTATLPADAIDDNLCADLQLSLDGRYAYVTNRGHDSIATIDIDLRNGSPRVVDWTGSGGSTPRSLTISPDGKAVVVANQNSERLVVLRRDPVTGQLGEVLCNLTLGSPTFVLSLLLS